MKQLILLVTVIITIANLYPANQGELAEILKPETIRIAGAPVHPVHYVHCVHDVHPYAALKWDLQKNKNRRLK